MQVPEIQAPTSAPDTSPCFRVLVVEDEATPRRLIEKWCNPILAKSKFGHLIDYKTTCDEGWACAQERPYNFYIIDGQTPGKLNGPEVCQKILELYPEQILQQNAQVILYTAMKPSEIEKTGLSKKVKVIPKQQVQTLVSELEDRVRLFESTLASRKNSADAQLG